MTTSVSATFPGTPGTPNRILCLALVLLLGACAGEDDAVDAFSVGAIELTFEARLGHIVPFPKTFAVEVPPGRDTVYIGVTYDDGPTSPIRDVTFTIAGPESGEVEVRPKSPDALGTGVFTGRVMVVGCADPECNSQVKGSPKVVNVTYRIRPDLTVTPAALEFSQVAEGPLPPAQTLMPLSDHAGGIERWTTAVLYESGDGWLEVTPESGIPLPNEIRVGVKRSMPAGLHRATLRLALGPHQVEVPVSLNVSP
jgi:hypothetical protein